MTQMTVETVKVTLITLAVGALGAAIASILGLPVAVLIGPAVAVSVMGLMGFRSDLPVWLREIGFLVLGIGIGAGFNASAGGAMLRWPLAFAAIAVLLVLTVLICRFALVRWFGFSRASALLAASPGHLSFVIAIGAEMGEDVAKIAVVQSMRLLALTLVVPFVALYWGVEMLDRIVPAGDLMSFGHVALLVVLAIAARFVLAQFAVPAPTVLGAMGVSVIGHVSEVTPGVLYEPLVMVAFALMGILIGARFSDVSWSDFKSAAGAGVMVTLIGAGLAALFAVPVALVMGMNPAFMLAGFAPGGFETMIAVGIAIGAPPGLIAACHIVRLLILSALVPAMLRRRD